MINTKVLTRIKTTLEHELTRATDSGVKADIEEEIATIESTIRLIRALQKKEKEENTITELLHEQDELRHKIEQYP